ncbi:alpha/beta fold hydrolase [Bosea sp. 124]|uniref:alpha/beta fold hydrolase n=1 Tax=Bosea sp. 124 TaxID=2135642 RepID=UPI000D3B4A31|nr:alpha/beta fold hydrolase [Bosea sp. 124]PTM40720.1 alpha-beta hydrolase superfamily lysophospholipase [Bosea sp. 124]
MAVSLLRLLRPVIRISSLIAPRLTGRLAFTAFCTPPRPKQGANRAPAVKSITARLDGAARISVPFPCGSVTAYLFEPPAIAEPEPAPTVILLHGWTGEAAFMSAFVAPLLRAGFRVVAFDLPAHGQSTGAELNLPIGVASLAAVARAFAPVHAIVAHSFGGSIALAALAGTVPAQPRVTAKRLAMISPPSSMAQVTRQFGTTIGLGRRGQAALAARIHSVAGVPVAAFEGVDQLARFGGPTLLVHCRDDKEVPFADAEALAEAGPFIRLESMQGLGHRRILQSRRVTAIVADFVAGRTDERSAQTQPISSRRTTASMASTPSGEAFRQGR